MDTNATNRTTNYGLPKFIATDKPSWLVDWNNTMDELDRVIKQGDPSAMQDALDQLTASVNDLVTRVTTDEGQISNLNTDINDAETGLKKLVADIQSDLVAQNTLIQQQASQISSLDTRVTALENA